MTPEEQKLRAQLADAVKRRDDLDKLVQGLELQIEAVTGKPLYPYRGLTATKAIRAFLEEIKSPQEPDLIVKTVMEGGCIISKRWPEVEVRKAITRNVQFGNFKDFDGKIGLPEWS
jgi:hypothetical protein